MPISGPFRVCRSCFLTLVQWSSHPRFLQIRSRYASRSIKTFQGEKTDDSSSSTSSFRRTRPLPLVVYNLSLANAPIPYRQRKTLENLLSTLSRREILSPRQAARTANRLVSTLFKIDTNLGLKGLNPSILFNIYATHNTRIRREILAVIGSLRKATRTIQRDEVALSLLLHFAQHPHRYPLAFQKSLQVFKSQRHIPSNNILRYFLQRNYCARHISFSSKDLLQWLITGIVSTPSLRIHLPLLTRILRLSDIEWTPLRILHPLIWAYIPFTPDKDFISLERKYGRQSSLVGRLSYNTLVAQLTHTVRRCDPDKVDILLVRIFVLHLMQTNRILYAVLLFDALRENNLGSRLGSEILGGLLEILVRTDNFEDASRIYSTFLDSRVPKVKNNINPFDGINRLFEQQHVSFVQKYPDLFIDLLRGIRHSQQCQESITNLINLLPPDLISQNQSLAAEILRYAAQRNNRPLVQKTLQTVNHPFYDESYTPTPTPSPTPSTFTPHLWSAILYAHVHLGLINSSRLILQSMATHNLPPRPEDMSAIVSAVANQDLEAGYNLALDLFQSITIETYETILSLALRLDHLEIAQWAKNLVAYEGPRNAWAAARGYTDGDDAGELVVRPRVFEMSSRLAESLAKAEVPTCTARARGMIVRHVARREGMESAVLALVGSRMEFKRDVYDGLYEIAFERGEYEYGMWVANEMIERGWIPQNYRGLKARYNEVVMKKRRMGQREYEFLR